MSEVGIRALKQNASAVVAVHLAAALDLGDDLEGMVTYDDRLGDAARREGITVISPH